MSDETAVLEKDLYKKIVVNNESLNDIAQRFSTTTAILKEINPFLEDTAESTILRYTYLYVPNKVQTAGIAPNDKEVIVRTNTLKPVIDQIKPKLCEILHRIRVFDEKTRSLTTQSNRQRKENNEELIYTHFNVLWGINSKTFEEAEADAYVGYKKKIFATYEKALRACNEITVTLMRNKLSI